MFDDFYSVVIAPLLKLSFSFFPKKNVQQLCFLILAMTGMMHLSVELKSCHLLQILLLHLDVMHTSPGIVLLIFPDYLFLWTVVMLLSSLWPPLLDQLLFHTMQRCLPRLEYVWYVLGIWVVRYLFLPPVYLLHIGLVLSLLGHAVVFWICNVGICVRILVKKLGMWVSSVRLSYSHLSLIPTNNSPFYSTVMPW